METVQTELDHDNTRYVGASHTTLPVLLFAILAISMIGFDALGFAVHVKHFIIYTPVVDRVDESGSGGDEMAR